MTAVEEYTEYETAPIIASRWHDAKLIGTCSKCGMDDCPIVWGRNDPTVFDRCKWCMEYRNIKYHLEHNGVRRLRKKKNIFPNLQPRIGQAVFVAICLVPYLVFWVLYVVR